MTTDLWMRLGLIVWLAALVVFDVWLALHLRSGVSA